MQAVGIEDEEIVGVEDEMGPSTSIVVESIAQTIIHLIGKSHPAKLATSLAQLKLIHHQKTIARPSPLSNVVAGID